MVARKYIRKKKSAISKPRRKYVGRTRYGRRKAVYKTKLPVDHTVTKYNPGKEKTAFVRKGLKLNAPFSTGTTGTTGCVWTLGSTAYETQGVMVFDPAGQRGNNSGNLSYLFPSGATLVQANIPEWSSYSALYSQYKVTKITCRFEWTTSGNPLSYAFPEMFFRYNNDYNVADPTLSSISEEKNWVRKQFTLESRSFTYSFYPKVMYLADNPGVLATEGRVAKKMRFMDMSNPIALYGLKFYMKWPGAINTTYADYISMDVQYDIVFKEQN